MAQFYHHHHHDPDCEQSPALGNRQARLARGGTSRLRHLQRLARAWGWGMVVMMMMVMMVMVVVIMVMMTVLAMVMVVMIWWWWWRWWSSDDNDLTKILVWHCIGLAGGLRIAWEKNKILSVAFNSSSLFEDCWRYTWSHFCVIKFGSWKTHIWPLHFHHRKPLGEASSQLTKMILMKLNC